MNTTNAPQFFLSISVNLPYDISITYKIFEEAEIVTFVSIVLGLALLLLNQIAAADLVNFHDPTASMGISFECGTSRPQHSQDFTINFQSWPLRPCSRLILDD